MPLLGGRISALNKEIETDPNDEQNLTTITRPFDEKSMILCNHRGITAVENNYFTLLESDSRRIRIWLTCSNVLCNWTKVEKKKKNKFGNKYLQEIFRDLLDLENHHVSVTIFARIIVAKPNSADVA